MMTDNHPITPPPELVREWLGTYFGTTIAGEVSKIELALATQAAQWGADQQLKLDAEQIAQAYQAGADQELEACCKWISSELRGQLRPAHRIVDDLRAARRPKPLSLKEQALADLDSMSIAPCLISVRAKYDNIRRALEALPND
jgi:hypothetical protein